MPEPGGLRAELKALAVAAAGYLAAILAFTWPVAARFRTRIVGDEYAGAWRTLWAHAWTLRRLLRDHAWPLDAPEIAFPRGGSFSSIAPLNDLLSLLPQLLWGLVPAYNLVVLGHMLLAATGGWALGRSAGLGRAGAAVAGAVFGFNSFLLSYGIASAVVETNTAGWIAWFLVAALWLLRRPGPRSALAAGLAFGITGVACLYWALITGLLAPLVLVPALVDRLRAAADGRERRRLLGWVVVGVVVAGVAFAIPGTRLLATYQDQGALLQDYAVRKQQLLPPDVMASLAHDYASVAGYLLPGARNLAVHADMDRLVQSTYAGWLALALASYGLGRGRWRWFVAGMAGAVLSLGPFAFFTQHAWRPEPVWWWVALRAAFPPVRMVTSYVRFSVFFFIGLAVLAGAGADRFAAWLRARSLGRLAPWAGPALALAILAEIAFLSPAPVPVPSAVAWVPQASLALRDLPEEGAVLDWPQRYPGKKIEVSRYFYDQTFHWRPIAYDFAPTSYMPGPLEGNAFFARLERITYGEGYDSGAWGEESRWPILAAVLEMQEMGYAYVVLHPWFVEPARLADVRGFLDAVLERVEDLPDGGTIYRVAPADDWEPELPW